MAGEIDTQTDQEYKYSMQTSISGWRPD